MRRDIMAIFQNDRTGSAFIPFALMLPVLVSITLSGVDYAWAVLQKQAIQQAADTAAIAGGKELSLSDSRRQNVEAVVEAMVLASIGHNTRSLVQRTQTPPVVDATITDNPLQVEVKVVQPVHTQIGGLLGIDFPPITVKSIARVVGRPNICVLALEPSEIGAIWLVRTAKMTGNGCSIFSNSVSDRGLAVRDGAFLSATAICSAGGIEQQGIITPAPLVDCPQFADPLASRQPPPDQPCQYGKIEIDSGMHHLSPGVYCEGIEIRGTAEVVFDPGDYIIKSGLFRVRDQAKIAGHGVSFYLGDSTWLNFGRDTSVSLSATRTGPMAGIIFFASRNQSRIITHTIMSRGAQEMVGTIYMPTNSLVVDGDASVGGDSAYTAIVARRVVLLNGPHLILNSNYSQTDVPVPAGIKGAGQPVALVN